MKQFPWYDAWWLEKYVRAKAYIARHRPARLAAFTGALAPLRTRPDFETRLLDGFFSPKQTETIRTAYRSIGAGHLETHEVSRHGRFVVHDHPALVELHASVAPAVGDLVGEEVEPAYSFIALYNRDGKCPVHLDAPVSKWTLDFCIDQSEPWPIAFSEVIPWPEDGSGNSERWEEQIKCASGHRFTSVAMATGQAVLFSGSSQWHYREPIANPGPRSHCDLLFMHFIPTGMRKIAEWKNWETVFNISGLTAAIR